MNKVKFEKSLKLGLGRVILYLKSHDYMPYKEIILNACLHNISHDPQMEGYKTTYMMEILQLTQNVDFYREQILQVTSAIDEDTDYHDARHLVELTSVFAEQGDSKAHQIIYDVFNANLEENDTLGGRYIIESGGINGFVYLANKLAYLQRNNANPKADSYFLWILKEKIGEDTARNELNKIRQSNKPLDYYLSLVEKSRNEMQRNYKVHDLPQTYAEFKVTNKNDSFGLAHWGQTATKADLELVAHDLIKENDPIKIQSYLRLFQRTSFPLDPKLLFRFMDMHHPHISLPALALSVLAMIEHPAVREFALDLINKNKQSGSAVRLLAQNYKKGDWKLIEILSRKIEDKEQYHYFTWGVRDIFKEHPSPSATQAIRNIYYNNPCSFCRERTLDMLNQIDGLTASILNECLYDSNLDIREWAKNITLN